jgi:hypothetical protein
MEALQRIQVRYAVAGAFFYLIMCNLRRRATRPESDSTKLLRNVRRTRPKVCISTSYFVEVSYSKRIAPKLVVVWVGWLVDRWWYAPFSSVLSE